MANFFTRFLNKLRPKDDNVLGVDVGASSIKVVQLGRKGDGAVLETYGEISLGPYAGLEVGRATNLTYEKIVVALKDVLRESKTTTKKCGMAIPIVSSLVSVIEMPEMSDKELSKMVPIEARKYVPVPITEVALDWWVIPKEEQTQIGGPLPKAAEPVTPRIPNIEVLLAVIHNDAISKYQNISKNASLESRFFEIEIFSSIRATLDHAAGTVMVLDFGAASTKLYIIEKGILRKSHIIDRGSQDITLAISQSLQIPVAEAEIMKREIGYSSDPKYSTLAEIIPLTLEYIFSETNHVIVSYQRQTRKNVEKVILTGGGVNLKGFTDIVRQTIENPIEIADPYSKVEAPAFLGNMLRSAGPEFAVALGVALRRLKDSE